MITEREIVSLEWMLLEQAGPVPGRAPCQEEGFSAMRTSQLMAWNQDMRESYYRDLREAAEAGRNPFREQAGYLLERTDPAEYERIKASLPERSPEKDYLLDWICQAHAAWQEELAVRYPRLTGGKRGIRRDTDSACCTSFETRLWAELTACSVRTLRLYAAYVERLQKAGENLNGIIFRNIAATYGWRTLEDAEARLAAGERAARRKCESGFGAKRNQAF